MFLRSYKFFLMEFCLQASLNEFLNVIGVSSSYMFTFKQGLPFEWRGPGAHCVAIEMSHWTYHGTL